MPAATRVAGWALAVLALAVASVGGTGDEEGAEVPGDGAATHTDVDETTLAVARHWACAIHTSASAEAGGRVVCWGDLPPAVSAVPADPFVQISAGGDTYVCGVTTALALACWGAGVPHGFTTLPRQRWEQVSAAPAYACAVALNGALHCFGTHACTRFLLD